MRGLVVHAAVEAAARAWRDENARRWPAFAVEWDDLPAATRRNDLAVMTAALAAAAPLIEAAVREQVTP